MQIKFLGEPTFLKIFLEVEKGKGHVSDIFWNHYHNSGYLLFPRITTTL